MIRSRSSRWALRALAALTAIVISACSKAAPAETPAPAAGSPTPAAAPSASASTPAAPAARSGPAAPDYLASYAEAMEIGRATVRAAFTGQLDSLVATADPATGSSNEVRARLTDGIAQISLQLGAERRMISERVMRVEGRVEYWRTAEYEMVPVPLIFRVMMGEKGTWRGFTAGTEDMTPAGEEMKP